LAAAALNNAGIDPDVQIRAANNNIGVNAKPWGPAIVKADKDEIVYEITFDLPDADLEPGQNVVPAGADKFGSKTQSSIASSHESPEQWQYPQQSCRSVVGHEPYDSYPPRIAFLQQGEVRACRSVFHTMEFMQMLKEERMHATTSSQINSEPKVDCTQHTMDPELVTESKDKMKVWGYLMTQYNLKPRLSKFGDQGATAARDKLTQLHIIDTWKAMDPSKISREEQMKVLSSLLFLKEKRMGKVKGWACIHGAPQRAYIPKEEAALPTVLTKLTFIMAAIAASERRKVRCYDIPSAFKNTDVDEDVLMVLKGELVDMMVQIAPQVYQKHVTIDKKGMPILHVKLQKALYGLMRASLLFYRKL
jgi:hypothetical protein